MRNLFKNLFKLQLIKNSKTEKQILFKKAEGSFNNLFQDQTFIQYFFCVKIKKKIVLKFLKERNKSSLKRQKIHLTICFKIERSFSILSVPT